jgi:hypothetical protein
MKILIMQSPSSYAQNCVCVCARAQVDSHMHVEIKKPQCEGANWMNLAQHSCEHGNELLGSIKGSEFLDWLSDNKKSAPCSQLVRN